MNNVHFAIPEIYGETLSYYELLRKLVDKVNDLIDNYNTVPDQIAEEVKKLDAYSVFTTAMNWLIHSIATDNTKSKDAVKQYKKHDLLYATFNDTVNLYEAITDFTNVFLTELKVDENIREVNISELLIELRTLIDTNKNDIAVIKENLGYITPEMFGAIGDGVNDDTNAIKEAISNSKVVLFTKTYAISEIIDIPTNSFLIGNNATIILTTKEAGLSIINKNTVHINGLIIDGCNVSDYCIHVRQAYSIEIKDCTLKNATIGLWGDMFWQSVVYHVTSSACEYGFKFEKNYGNNDVACPFYMIDINAYNNTYGVYFGGNSVNCGNWSGGEILDNIYPLFINNDYGTFGGFNFENINFESNRGDYEIILGSQGNNGFIRNLRFTNCRFVRDSSNGSALGAVHGINADEIIFNNMNGGGELSQNYTIAFYVNEYSYPTNLNFEGVINGFPTILRAFDQNFNGIFTFNYTYGSLYKNATDVKQFYTPHENIVIDNAFKLNNVVTINFHAKGVVGAWSDVITANNKKYNIPTYSTKMYTQNGYFFTDQSAPYIRTSFEIQENKGYTITFLIN